MAIQGIDQPAVIQIDESLRLRKYDGVYDFALAWYQSSESIKKASKLSTLQLVIAFSIKTGALKLCCKG